MCIEILIKFGGKTPLVKGKEEKREEKDETEHKLADESTQTYWTTS